MGNDTMRADRNRGAESPASRVTCPETGSFLLEAAPEVTRGRHRPSNFTASLRTRGSVCRWGYIESSASAGFFFFFLKKQASSAEGRQRCNPPGSGCRNAAEEACCTPEFPSHIRVAEKISRLACVSLCCSVGFMINTLEAYEFPGRNHK